LPPLDQKYNGQFVDGDGKSVVNASSKEVVKISDLGYAYETPSGLVTGPGAAPAIAARSLFAAPAPRVEAVLGATRQNFQATANRTTNVAIETTNLAAALFSPHPFRLLSPQGEARLGAEPGRVLARIVGVNAPSAARGLVVNVFINLPQAGPQTPFTDPHYAGTFSFFGMAGQTHHPGDYLVDLTSALSNLAALGGLESKQLTIQVVPLPVGPNAPEAGFSFDGTEIIRG
jgi:tyrosinase